MKLCGLWATMTFRFPGGGGKSSKLVSNGLVKDDDPLTPFLTCFSDPIMEMGLNSPDFPSKWTLRAFCARSSFLAFLSTFDSEMLRLILTPSSSSWEVGVLAMFKCKWEYARGGTGGPGRDLMGRLGSLEEREELPEWDLWRIVWLTLPLERQKTRLKRLSVNKREQNTDFWSKMYQRTNISKVKEPKKRSELEPRDWVRERESESK